jgi:hypothetical protein
LLPHSLRQRRCPFISGSEVRILAYCEPNAAEDDEYLRSVGTRSKMPAIRGTARLVQWLTSPGGSEQVSTRTWAAISGGRDVLTGGRVLSRSWPPTPSSANRCCQRYTADRLTRTCRATSCMCTGLLADRDCPRSVPGDQPMRQPDATALDRGRRAPFARSRPHRLERQSRPTPQVFGISRPVLESTAKARSRLRSLKPAAISWTGMTTAA